MKTIDNLSDARGVALKALALLLLLAISFPNFAAKPKQVRVIFTTDVHGAIFPYDFVEQKARAGSLAQVCAYVKDQRKHDPKLLLLDNGDMLQGQPTVYYYNFVDTLSLHLQARVMNFMGYNALTVGNHDIEPGHPVYDRVRKQSNFPWLAANAVTASGKCYFDAYKIFMVDGKKIAVLGLITPAIPSWLPESIWRGMTFNDMVESAKYWVDIIQKKERPDAIIGMVHSGVNFNYNNQNEGTYKNENAAMLIAKRVKGFDAILCGHDHEIFNKKVATDFGDSVQVLNPAAFARNVGVLSIFFDGKDKRVTGSVVDVRPLPADSEFEAKFKADFSNIKEFSSRKIGTLDETITSADAFFGSSSFVDLVHRSMLKVTKADISFASPLTLNATIPAGSITVGDMFNLYKYENLLYVLTLTGQEVKDYLEYSYGLWVKAGADVESGMLLLNDKGKLKNQYYNFDSGAGIRYTVDITKPTGSRISIESMADGVPFDLGKTYKVAMSSYRGNGGGGHLTVGAKIQPSEIGKRLVFSTSNDLRYLIMMDIMKAGKLDYKPMHLWKFIPEDIVAKARMTDESQIFRK
jgi:2',3'-cyclic-nucleotide 2'-phosphodiesterase / 3'-nucleotidase